MAERGCSDLKQGFKREEREQGRAFGRKSVELVKVWILMEVNRREVVIALGDFSLEQGSACQIVHRVVLPISIMQL